MGPVAYWEGPWEAAGAGAVVYWEGPWGAVGAGVGPVVYGEGPWWVAGAASTACSRSVLRACRWIASASSRERSEGDSSGTAVSAVRRRSSKAPASSRRVVPRRGASTHVA